MERLSSVVMIIVIIDLRLQPFLSLYSFFSLKVFIGWPVPDLPTRLTEKNFSSSKEPTPIVQQVLNDLGFLALPKAFYASQARVILGDTIIPVLANEGGAP